MQKRTSRQSYELIYGIISDECDRYLQHLVKQELKQLAPYEEDITKHNLMQPYKNYMQEYELLESLKRLFMLYDSSFPSKTLQKLHRVVQTIWSHYRGFQKRNSSAKAVFENLFLYQSELYYHLNGEIARFKKKHLASKNLQKEIDLLEKDKKALRYFYFKIFSQKYRRQKRMLDKRYKIVLNCYVFHFDLLLWDDAKASVKIAQRLFEMGFREFSTGAYIKHKLSLSLPYSGEYQKLQKMYRNYL